MNSENTTTLIFLISITKSKFVQTRLYLFVLYKKVLQKTGTVVCDHYQLRASVNDQIGLGRPKVVFGTESVAKSGRTDNWSLFG